MTAHESTDERPGSCELSSLRGLERDGLVTRTVYPTVPPQVEYALRHVAQWADTHGDSITTARATYQAS